MKKNAVAQCTMQQYEEWQSKTPWPNLGTKHNAAARRVMPRHKKTRQKGSGIGNTKPPLHMLIVMCDGCKKMTTAVVPFQQKNKHTINLVEACSNGTATPDIALLLPHGIATTAALPPMLQVDCCIFFLLMRCRRAATTEHHHQHRRLIVSPSLKILDGSLIRVGGCPRHNNRDWGFDLPHC